MNDAKEIVEAVITHGLRLRPEDLTDEETQTQFREVERILASGQDPKIVLGAAKSGMDHVWPFSQGDVWGAAELRKNLLRAKGFAGRERTNRDDPLGREHI
jgi:hypothetical protein